MKVPLSVGYRLFLLVGFQTGIAIILVLMALRAISGMAADYKHMYEFQLQSLYAIRIAMEEAETLEPGFRSKELNEFYHQYRTQWEVASGNTPDAVHFRRDLLEVGEIALPRRESELLMHLERSIPTGDVHRVREELAGLYSVNLKYVDLANRVGMKRNRSNRIWLLSLGTGGIALTLFLGLHVRSAIAPRIRKLVVYVRRFQETGNYERINETGKDDIAVLANALNAGFSAIALRDRDREQFLAIAAHELKTPVTSIQGYASLLVKQPQQQNHQRQALEIINRQAWRLSRLIEALFLALRARSGDLRFEPKPLNMSLLVERVLHEMEPFVSKTAFSSQISGNISILGDEGLLEHALWSLFTCATTLRTQDSSILIALSTVGPSATLTVDIKESNVPANDVQELFTPFRSVAYETGDGMRAPIGLYLCREIVRVHNGQLRVRQVSEERPEFVMELPV